MCHGYWSARRRMWEAEREDPRVTEIRDPEVREPVEPVDPVLEEEIELAQPDRDEVPAGVS